jgi:hypothetical protein
VSVTASSAQARIVLLVGDVDPATGDPPSPSSNGILAQNIATLWDYHAYQDAVAPGLRALYVEQDAINLVLTVLRAQVDMTIGSALSVKQSQQTASLTLRLKAIVEQIATIEKRQGAGVPVAAAITRTAPITPADAAVIPQQIDANDPRYGGDAYRPPFTVERGR